MTTTKARKRALACFSRTRSALFGEHCAGGIRCRAALERAQQVLERGGTGFAVVLYPCLWRERGRLANAAAFATVAGRCRARGIPRLDPEFAARDVDLLRVDPRDYHAGAEAHRIAGEAIATWLVTSGLLPEQPGR